MEAQRAASGERDEGTTGASQRAACRAPCSLSIFRAAFLVACCLSLLRQQQEDGLRGPAVHRSELRFVALCSVLSFPFVSFRFLSFPFVSFPFLSLLLPFLFALLCVAFLSFACFLYFPLLPALWVSFVGFAPQRRRQQERHPKQLGQIQGGSSRSKAGAADPRRKQQIPRGRGGDNGLSNCALAPPGRKPSTGPLVRGNYGRISHCTVVCAQIWGGVFRTVLLYARKSRIPPKAGYRVDKSALCKYHAVNQRWNFFCSSIEP